MSNATDGARWMTGGSHGAWIPIVLLGVAALAGCAGDASDAQSPAAPEPGTLHGRVLDDELLPLPGARVSLVEVPDITNRTGADGRFLLHPVPPGSYTLLVEAPPRPPAARSVLVEPANAPEELTITLAAQAAPGPDPYHKTLTPGEGLLGCGAGLVVSVACPGYPAHVERGTFRFDGGLTGLVWVLEWSDSDALSAKNLNLTWREPGADSSWGWNKHCDGNGTNPVRTVCRFSTDVEANGFFQEGSNAEWRVTPNAGAGVSAGSTPDAWVSGAAGPFVEQRFTVHVTQFYWGASVPAGFDPRATS